jgi:hypothetical protein
MADPTPLNRNQIAAFVGNDPDAIRAIERLFLVAGQLTPAEVATLTQLIADNILATGAASNVAEVALATATAAERQADLVALDDTKAEVAMSVATDAKRLADLTATAPAPIEQRLDQLQDVRAFAPAAGMVIIYDATKRRWLANTITAGSNITVTNADGSITIDVSGLGTMAFENTGASGSFLAGIQTVTVVNGIITSIV